MDKRTLKRIIREELGNPAGEAEYEKKRKAQMQRAAAGKSQRKAADADELGKQMSQPVDMSLASSEVKSMGGTGERKYHKLPIPRITGNYDAAKVVVNNPELLAWVRKNVGPDDRVMGQMSKGGPDPSDVVDGRVFLKAVDYMQATKDSPAYEPPTSGQKDSWESDYFNEGRNTMSFAKKRLMKIIKEELMILAERQRPGHRDPESGNWQYPGDSGYDPRRDDSLHPAKSDYGLGEEEYTKALRAHPRGGPVDPSWEHPLEHLLEYGSRYGDQGERATADMTDEEKEWFQRGVEAGSHGGSGYDDMPHPTDGGGVWYDAWERGFDHAKSGGY